MFRSVTSFKNGQYRVVEQIGAGTFGEAFQVIDRCDRKMYENALNYLVNWNNKSNFFKEKWLRKL